MAEQSPLSQSSSEEWRKAQSIWSLQRAGGLIIFCFIIIAYVIQTELTQAVQRTYHKPYFLLFLTHSGYTFLLPIHLFVLKLLEPSVSISDRLNQIKQLIILQFSHQALRDRPAEIRSLIESVQDSDLQPLIASSRASKQQFPYWWFIKRCLKLTLFLTLPAMCWYASIPFADMTSITAVSNTNSCFAYVFSVWFLESENFETRKTVGVIGSLVGALMISWSERSSSSNPVKIDDGGNLQPLEADGQLRWVGIGLALLGSIGYALYEVWYKKVIALVDSSLFDGLSSGAHPSPKPTPILSALPDIILHPPYHSRAVNLSAHGQDYTQLVSDAEEEDNGKHDLEEAFRSISTETMTSNRNGIQLLYSNFMTTLVGLVTMSLLWIPIPILHHIGLEKFELVKDPHTACMILGIVIMGVTFNAGFMILLSLWGPVISSVGNLCALVLIAVVEKIMMRQDENNHKQPFQVDFLSFFGSCFILFGFSILVYFEKK